LALLAPSIEELAWLRCGKRALRPGGVRRAVKGIGCRGGGSGGAIRDQGRENDGEGGGGRDKGGEPPSVPPTGVGTSWMRLLA
jgi:hypothetical protein